MAGLFAGFVSGKSNVWSPADPDVFCRDWLRHVTDRGHLAELGGEAAVLATLQALGENANMKAWGTPTEIIVGGHLVGRTVLIVLADNNPTMFYKSWEYIQSRAEGLKEIKDLGRVRGLFRTCQQVWERELSPQPVRVPVPVRRQIDLTPIFFGGAAMAFVAFLATLVGGRRREYA